MKNRLFGGKEKSKQSSAPDSSSNSYTSPLPAHARAPSPGYPQAVAQQGYPANSSQSTLDRSPSLRQSSGQFGGPPPRPVAVVESNFTPEQLEQRLQENRNSSYVNQGHVVAFGNAPPPPQEKEKRGLRDKFFGHSSKQSQDQARHQSGLGRSVSVSKKRESVPPEAFYKPSPGQGATDARSPYRRSANSSQNLLNTHTEEDEDSHSQHNIYTDPRYQQGPPPPPAKELDYERGEHRYSQQPVPPQAYYKDPRSQLTRVQTSELLKQGQASQDPRSPGGQGTWYREEGSDHRDSYHQYQQGGEEGTPSTPYHNSPDDESRYSSYSQQPPAYSQHGRGSSGPTQQPELHYPQPGPGRASIEKYNRPPSQPQGPPGGAYEQTSDPANPLFLQAPPRGTSLEGPPSPLVAAAGAPLGGQKGPQPPPSPAPPSTADSNESQETMPQSGRSQGNNTIRSVGGEKGASTSSGMQSPPPVPPHKQGVPAYGANVVPAGSQGAPFKGSAAAAAAASAGGSQRGRDSPAPEQQMAPVELVDEEAASYLQLQKEYKELREKYQKVKKYYFEKEAQVHSLQNTLAHQRLAASRTSLDDSEYAARFSRLDGLISQLAFSIRKSWKTIPDFLQRGVNKDAILTGKQEMTAVGKAYMSHWLVSNLFDMYFHPSLELGLSRDLKEVWHNVRKYCPPFQSGEEEEALNAKLVNWRMTTIDGLQERLRAPEASTHYTRLVEMLNEKMVGDMSLLLSDPAPPDLAGGVSMIVELAVAVAQHIPTESRDVAVEYYYPGAMIVPDMMKVEGGIPALTNAIAPSEGSPTDGGDRASLKSTDTRESTDPRDSTDGPGGAAAREEKKARGMFGGLMSGSSGGAKVSKAPPTSGPPPPAKTNAPTAGRDTPVKEEKVRLCVGISVQIRGRSVLAKASVYGMAV